MSISKNDCVKCGACCTQDLDLDSYIDAELEEARKIPEKYKLPMVVYGFVPIRTVLNPRDKPGSSRCMALKGIVGTRVACDIYENRPSTCRELKPGSDACLLHRRDFGLDDPS